MAFLILQLLIGVAVLAIATHFLIHLAKKLSKIFKISPLIIGITVVAIGTSLPELSVSSIAVLEKDTGLALGNVIGSNIVNIFLVLSLAILTSNFHIGSSKTQRNMFLLLGITLLFILLKITLFPTIISALLLLSLTVAITAQEYQWGINDRDREDLLLFKYFHPEKLSPSEILLLPFLIGGIIVGGLFIVNSVEQISILSGYSTTILGLSLTAIATSSPELLATLISTEEHQEKIALGDIIGSNIYNLLLIGGVITLFSTTSTMSFSEIIWLLASMVIFLIIVLYYRGKIVPKKIGLILLASFFLYLYTIYIH